jgi:hypothetical protein
MCPAKDPPFRASAGRKRRARSEPAPLAEEGEARAAVGPSALGDGRGKLSAPGTAQQIFVTQEVDGSVAVWMHAYSTA